MKKALIICTLLSYISTTIIGQDYPKTFGTVSVEELTMSSYDADPEAEALKLFDIGDTRFLETPEGFIPELTRTCRIKILNTSGLNYANVSIPFYTGESNLESIYEVHGITHNFKDNKVEKVLLGKDDIYLEKVNEYWSRIKFAMPAVEVGSVIEFQYKHKTESHHYLQEWYFQDKIPTIFSEYTARITPFYAYTFILQGVKELDSFKSYEDKDNKRLYGMGAYYDIVHVMQMNNIPAFKDEEFITSVKDYLIKVSFQLSSFTNLRGAVTNYMTTWEKMCLQYQKDEDFGRYIDKSERMSASILPEEIDKSMDVASLSYEVVDFVKNNYSWNGFNSHVAGDKPKDLVDNKTGSIAEINLFLIGLLRGSGLEAYPVLLSTRNHGKIPKDYPFSSFFNYVIAAVKTENGFLLLDATDPLCPNDRIPNKCFNEKGVIFDPEILTWIPLEFNQPSNIKKNLIFDINEDRISSNVKVSATEYDARELRTIYSNNSESLESKLKSKYNTKDVGNIQIQNYEDLNKPYAYLFTLKESIQGIDKKLFIPPFQNEAINENPLKQKTRNHPVDFIYPKQRSFTVIINIPETYKVEHVPKNLQIDNDLVNINYKTVSLEGLLKIQFSYTTKKSVYLPEEYTDLKSYLDLIVEKATDKVILEKK